MRCRILIGKSVGLDDHRAIFQHGDIPADHHALAELGMGCLDQRDERGPIGHDAAAGGADASHVSAWWI
jgi:hypothetical protein